MEQIIHPQVLTNRQGLAEAFRSARFYPHVVIDDFFTEQRCRALLEQFPPYETKHALNEFGEVGLKAVREAVRGLGPAYIELDDCARSASFLSLISNITGIADLRYDPEYVGGGTHDNQHGTELDVHVDFNLHPSGLHRRLNLIVFLHPVWEAAWGGCFEIHRDPWSPDDEVISVVPTCNRAVIFETSERSWHGFNKIQLPADQRHLSRKSFALYLYTTERPADEIAPAHATVYVPRPLPEHLIAGHTLEQNDVAQLAEAIARRDQQMRFLYEREKEFSAMLARQRARIESLEAILGNLPIDGYAKLVDRAEGLWEDLWAADTLTFRLRAEQPLTNLRLEGWVPEGFPTGRSLSVELGGQAHRAVLGNGTFELDFPVALEAQSELDVCIRCPQTLNPKAAGQSNDGRELAYLVSSLVVT